MSSRERRRSPRRRAGQEPASSQGTSNPSRQGRQSTSSRRPALRSRSPGGRAYSGSASAYCERTRGKSLARYGTSYTSSSESQSLSTLWRPRVPYTSSSRSLSAPPTHQVNSQSSKFTGQTSDSRSPTVEQIGDINRAIVEAEDPLSTSAPASNLPSSSLGHLSTPPPSTQQLDQVGVEESLGSYAQAKLTLERAARLLNPEAVDSNLSISESLSLLTITDTVKAKWLEFLELSNGGFPAIVDKPRVSARLKDLLNELCKGDARFTKSHRFRKHCEDFLNDFLIGVETYRKNNEKVISLANSEKGYQYPRSSIEEASKDLKANYTALKILLDEQTALEVEEADLKQRLAEVHHQQKLKNIQMAQVEEVLHKSIDSFKTLQNEKDRLDKEMDEKRCIKNQCLLENSRLDHFMSAFQEEVKTFVNNM